MSLLRSLVVCGLFFGLVGVADAAKAAKKQAAAGTIRGTVKEVTPDKDNKDVGTLTIQTVAKKKKKAAAAAADAAPAGETKKIVITKETKIEKVDAPAKGQKKAPLAAGTSAKFSDLQTNANVVVTLKTGTDTAEKVQIVAGGKKAKKAKNQ
jgi:hypothetical protein